jgi:hypothetical protein
MSESSHQFTDRHYVPILKFKKGEIAALTNLSGTSREKITPLLEIQPSQSTPESLIQDIVECRGEGVSFIDCHACGELGPMTLVDLLNISIAMQPEVKIIPVISPLDDAVLIQFLATHPAVQRRGIALRLGPSEFAMGDQIAGYVNLVRQIVNLPFGQIHLIVDLGEQTSAAHASAQAQTYFSWLQPLDRFGTLTLAIAGFPNSTNVMGLAPNAWHDTLRVDWAAWQMVNQNPPGRRASFGDYTVRDTMPPAQFSPKNATMRYTTTDHFLIYRQPFSGGAGFGNVRIGCGRVITHPAYRGPAFSWGDNQMQLRANGLIGTGSPTSWVADSINQHLEFVGSQI